MDNRNISLKQMRAFAAVGRVGSFTRAAEQLCITQSALSALIRNLESELDIQLIHRTTRKLELTDAGRELLRSVETLLEDIERMTVDVREVNALRRGRVRVGATPLLAASLLPMAIRSFSLRYPEITVRLVDQPIAPLLQQLRLGDLDIVLATMDRQDAEFHTETLLRDAMVLVCSSTHECACREAMTWAQIAPYPIVALTPESGLRRVMDQAFGSLGLTPRLQQEVEHVATAIAMAAAGLGVAVLPAYALKFNAHQDVRAIQLLAPSLQRDVSMIRTTYRTPAPAVQAMLAHLADCFPLDHQHALLSSQGLC